MKPLRYTLYVTPTSSDMKTCVETSGFVVCDNTITDPLDGVAIVAFSSLRWVVPDGLTFLVLERLPLTADVQYVDAIPLRWLLATFRFSELDDWLSFADGEDLFVIDNLELIETAVFIQLWFDTYAYCDWLHVHLLESIDEAL